MDPGSEAIELAPGRTVLSRTADGPLSDMSVSRHGPTLDWDPSTGRLVGEAAGSRNSARIDGITLGLAPYAIEEGSVLRLGDVIFVVELGTAADEPFDALPGRAVATRRLRTELAAAARESSPLLLVGETGVGKEALARELHFASGRPGPFLKINCDEHAGELVLLQVQGHARRGFNGTLLLDEIGELPAAMQSALLGMDIPKDMRVIAATTRDLPDLVAELMIWQIRVPPLRARRLDIMLWFHRQVDAWSARHGGTGVIVDADVIEAIVLAPWPDNLRGLDRLAHKLASSGGTDLAGLNGFLGALAPTSSVARRVAPTTDELRASVGEHNGSMHPVARWINSKL